MRAEFMYDYLKKTKKHFLFLPKQTKKCAIIYFDNTSTILKPIFVIEKMNEVYREYPIKIHKEVPLLVKQKSLEDEEIHENIRQFINAKSKKEIIFTKGTTDAINLIAHSFEERYIKKGDEVILTQMKHHANIVPWKIFCDRIGAVLKVVLFRPDKVLDLEIYKKLLSPNTKIVAVIYVSNSLRNNKSHLYYHQGDTCHQC